MKKAHKSRSSFYLKSRLCSAAQECDATGARFLFKGTAHKNYFKSPTFATLFKTKINFNKHEPKN